MSTLKPEQKAMLKKEIKKVRPEVVNQPSLETMPLDRLVETYIEMSVEVIKEMEKRTDPVFLEVLHYAQAHLTREEFLSIQIEVYAACNKIAMEHCTRGKTKLAHVVVGHSKRWTRLHTSSSYMNLSSKTFRHLQTTGGRVCRRTSHAAYQLY